MNRFFSKKKKEDTEFKTINPLFTHRPRTMTSVNSEPEPYIFVPPPHWNNLKEEIIHGMKKKISFGSKKLKNKKIKNKKSKKLRKKK